MKKKLICGFILLVLMILPINLLAITINGFTFDGNSANLTNQWNPMTVGTTWTYKETTTQETFYITGIDVQNVYGVDCFRVKVSNASNTFVQYFWYAQDVSGNIHVLKKIENGVTSEVNSDDDIPNFDMISNPKVGDSWSWTFDNHQTVEITVESTSETVVTPGATYTNCLKIRDYGVAGQDTNYIYHAPGLGMVKTVLHDGMVLLRQTGSTGSSDVYGVWVITDQRKYVDGTIRRRIMTEIEINEQGNTVSGADISNSGKVSFISGPLDDWGYWGEYRSFGKSWDPETPGFGLSQWMNETFDFAFHASDGDKHAFITTTNEFGWLPFIDLKIVQGGKNPTFKWDKVAAADQYRVRIVNPVGSGVLIDDTINADGSDSYAYTYSGNLFSQYDKLTFRIEARDHDSATGKQLVNRSAVFYEHSAVKAMPWIPLLLFDE